MTKIDATHNLTESAPSSVLRKVLITIIGGLTAVFSIAFLAGYTVAVTEQGGLNAYAIGTIAAGLVLIGLTVFISYKLWPKGTHEAVPAREKKSQHILWAAVVIGVLLGGYMAVASGDNPDGVFSNEPVTASFAVISIATWLIIVPIITWMWWRTIDEHEADAYREGALVSAHVYIFLAPTWWMAARAGWAPQQDPMIVLVIVSIVWSIVWLYRKYA